MIHCRPYRNSAARIIILCLFFTLPAALASKEIYCLEAPADTLILPMQQVKGFGPFQPVSAFLREREGSHLWHPAEPVVRGIPGELTGFFYQVEMMDFAQHAWQSCLAGLVDCDSVRDVFSRRGVDTTRLTDDFVDVYVVVGTGLDDEGRRKVVIHSGGTTRGKDGRAVIDISGTEQVLLPDPATGNPRRDRETMVVRPVRFELFDGEQIIQVTDWYRASGPIPFGSLLYDQPTLVIGTYSHRRGRLPLENRNVHFYMNNRFTAGAYTPESAYLYAGQARDEAELRDDQLIQTGENICLGNKPYRFDGVTPDGSRIRLVFEPHLVHEPGTQTGYHAPPLEASAFDPYGDGKHISLCATRGTWVFLHFWGTWCTSCVEDFPYMKEAWRLFGGTDEFHMIGVAYDSPGALKDFLPDRGIVWPQILEKQGANNRILSDWDIDGYPSTFFIDRDGIILKRQLNKYDLEMELAREIGFDGPAGERLKQGNIVLQKSFPDASNVSVRAGFSLPGHTPLYKVGGLWTRGFQAEPGNHLYRLYVDGVFTPDPENPRTETRNGQLYNVITVAK
jgi:peroxiredoxin